jgi:hypothetical protein
MARRSSNLALRNQVVKGIQNGTIIPSTGGIVRLPSTLENASDSGVAYITLEPGGATLVLCTLWVGKGSNLEGKLYWPNAPSPLPKTVEINGPYSPMKPGGPPSGPIDVVIEEGDGPNWYNVSFLEN